MKRIHLFSFFIIAYLCTASLSLAQQQRKANYVDIAFIKSKSENFATLQKDQWMQIHRQLIKEGRKTAWLLYKVKYPGGQNAGYDYVRFNMVSSWQQVEGLDNLPDDTSIRSHLNIDLAKLNEQDKGSHEVIWSQLFQLIDEAVTSKSPPKFLNVNQVKAVPGAESEYVKLETAYFKPFHAERVRRGMMNNWFLYKPILPYGSKYEYDYVTMNGYNTWEDITRNNPPDVWEKVHGKLNFNEIHTTILEKRITVNNELWELVAFAVE